MMSCCHAVMLSCCHAVALQILQSACTQTYKQSFMFEVMVQTPNLHGTGNETRIVTCNKNCDAKHAVH